MKNGHVYIIEQEDKKIKVGKSINPILRIRNLHTQGGFVLTNTFVSEKCSNYGEIESCMHKLLNKNHVIGEWFKADFEYAVDLLMRQKFRKPYSDTEIKNDKEKRLKAMCKFSGVEATSKMLANVEAQSLSDNYNYHCEHCNTPIELWAPLKSYSTERSCEVYSDFFGIIWDLEMNLKYTYDMVLEMCAALNEKYQDIKDISAIVKELISIGLDTGIITEKYILAAIG